MNSVVSTIDAEKLAPPSWRMCRSSRWRPRGRKILVVKSSCCHPVADDRPSEKALRPPVHFGGHLLGHLQEHRVAANRQLEVALVVQRHRRHLAERVFAVEHPPVGAGQQRVGDVAEAAVRRRARPCGRPGALDPLALQVGRNLAADEGAVARVLNLDQRPRNVGVRIEELDAVLLARPRRSPADPVRHHLFAVVVERRQLVKRAHHLGREDVVVDRLQVAADLQHSHVWWRPRR